MILYGKVINEETGLCEVGTGTNIEFYKSIGFIELDVKQSDVDNNYYLTKKCPMKTDEQKVQEEQERILSLSMTRGDFFDGTIKAFGADDVDLLKPIEALLSSMSEITDIDRKVALNSYKNALNFYRKHPLFDMLSGVDIILSEAQKINITSEQWDKFFDETNKKSVDAYKALLPEESKNENTTGTDTAEPTVNEDELPQESV